MWVNAPLSFSIPIYMVITRIPDFPRECYTENQIVSASISHCLLTLPLARATIAQGSLAGALWSPRRAWPVDLASSVGLPEASRHARVLSVIGLQLWKLGFHIYVLWTRDAVSGSDIWNWNQKHQVWPIPLIVSGFPLVPASIHAVARAKYFNDKWVACLILKEFTIISFCNPFYLSK